MKIMKVLLVFFLVITAAGSPACAQGAGSEFGTAAKGVGEGASASVGGSAQGVGTGASEGAGGTAEKSGQGALNTYTG